MIIYNLPKDDGLFGKKNLDFNKTYTSYDCCYPCTCSAFIIETTYAENWYFCQCVNSSCALWCFNRLCITNTDNCLFFRGCLSSSCSISYCTGPAYLYINTNNIFNNSPYYILNAEAQYSSGGYGGGYSEYRFKLYDATNSTDVYFIACIAGCSSVGCSYNLLFNYCEQLNCLYIYNSKTLATISSICTSTFDMNNINLCFCLRQGGVCGLNGHTNYCGIIKTAANLTYYGYNEIIKSNLLK